MNPIDISTYDYPLPEERIARFPLERREASRLLVWRGGEATERRFGEIGKVLPPGTLLVFNDTRVVRARIVMHRPEGARIEIFCLEPRDPADYERAFAARGRAVWQCMVGNAKRWKQGPLHIGFDHNGAHKTLTASRTDKGDILFEWDADLAFGQLLELLGRVPIPPYLRRESEATDEARYQTVYARYDGSVAAPTAGLHFSEELLASLRAQGVGMESVTLHVGAGTFLPVKGDDAAAHEMHAEHFEITLAALERLQSSSGFIVAVGTTTVRTLESLVALGWRISRGGSPETERTVGQWELYGIPEAFGAAEALSVLIGYMRREELGRLQASTRIMIVPGYRLRMARGLVTNFHQPRSTLLLLVAAMAGESWRRIYDYALAHDFRFLSYGDSSILLPDE